MKMQVVWVLVATLGLAGCGGGGGGSDDSDDLPDRNNVSASNLVGTWIQTKTSYFESSTPGERTWIRTLRETIVVEKVGSALKFTNCVTDGDLDGTLSGKVITFPVQDDVEEELKLAVADSNTMTTTYQHPTLPIETDVELSKVSNDTTIEMANANLTVTALTPLPVTITHSSWDQLCVESQLQEGHYFTEVRGRIDNSIDVSMRFDSFSPFVAGTYTYPGASIVVSGNFSLSSPDVEGELSDPISGSVILGITTQAVNYNVSNLVLQSDLGINVRVNGTISHSASWIESPQPE